VVTASADGEVITWDYASQTAVQRLRPHLGAIARAALDPPRRRLVTVGAEGARVFAVGDRDPAFTVRGPPCVGAAFDPQGALQMVSADGAVIRWASGRTQSRSALGTEPRMAQFSGDGRRLATAAPEAARVWESSPAGWRLLSEVAQPGLRWLALSGDGHFLLTGAGPQARLWAADSGHPLLVHEQSADLVAGSLNADGTRAATAAVDGWLQVWDARSGALLLRRQGGSASVQFCSAGNCLLTATGRQAELLDETGRSTRTFEAPAELGCARLSEDGSLLAAATTAGEALVFDAGSGALLGRLHGHSGLVAEVSFSPDGRWLGTCGADGGLKLWASKESSPH
jgi:WD40 repeat protein